MMNDIRLLFSGRDLAPSLGEGRKIFSRTEISERFFSEKNVHFHGQIFDDLFLVIDQVFRNFPFFSQTFRVFTMLNACANIVKWKIGRISFTQAKNSKKIVNSVKGLTVYR